MTAAVGGSLAPVAAEARRRTADPVIEALLGAVGSAGACLASNPIDVARVRIQLNLGLPRGQGSRGVWVRGLAPAMGYNAVFNGLRFYIFEAANTHTSLPLPASGVASGTIAGLLSSPLAQARTVQQAASAGGAPLPVAAVLRARPFAGAGSWAVRSGGHTGIIFTLYNNLRGLWAGALPGVSNAWTNLLASLQASVASCVVMNPVDVVATRMFNQQCDRLLATVSGGGNPRAPQGGAGRYASALDCARKTVAGEGTAGLYRGLGANLCRIVPHTALTFALVEAMRDWRVFGDSVTEWVDSLVWRALHHSRGSV